MVHAQTHIFYMLSRQQQSPQQNDQKQNKTKNLANTKTMGS